jgi:hypothetical protein
MTLDSGALVLVASLVEKVFNQPVQRGAVGVAVGAFLVSLIFGGLTYLNLSTNYPRASAQRMSPSDRRLYG